MKIDHAQNLVARDGASPDCVQARQAERRLNDAAVAFEGYFVTEMLKQMRRSTAVLAGAESALNDRVNGDMLDFADQTLGDTMAGQRAFGIADALIRQLLPTDHAAACASTIDAAPASAASSATITTETKNPT